MLGAVSQQYWALGSGALQAAVRFEVRLADTQPGPGLREAQIEGSAKVIYVYDESIVTNDDVAESRVVAGDAPSTFGVEVQLTAIGARKMREATEPHVGKPVAVLIDGRVVMAPVVRAPIGGLALISGRFTQAEAERIVNGIGVR